jgi:hypothetical protein
MTLRSYGNPPVLVGEGIKADPTANTVMADTGTLPMGLYEMRIFAGADALAKFQIQRRNAANGANVGAAPILFAAAGQTAQYVLTVSLETNERVRVLMYASLSGNADVTIQYERVS